MTKCRTIGSLEEGMLLHIPESDAESWDRTGLIAGNPAQEITGVAVALDPTVPAVRAARQAGANVLVTHHPPFLKAPESFRPGESISEEEGALVYEAIRQDVALMCFHTAFDMSEAGLHVLPQALGLDFDHTVLPLDPSQQKGKGYGAFCHPAPADARVTVAQWALRCQEVFGRKAIIWGDLEAVPKALVTAQGSAAEAAEAALLQGATCVICGELKYHDALPLSQAGLNIIELGHDVSELPLAHELAKLVETLCDAPVVELPQNKNWTCL